MTENMILIFIIIFLKTDIIFLFHQYIQVHHIYSPFETAEEWDTGLICNTCLAAAFRLMNEVEYIQTQCMSMSSSMPPQYVCVAVEMPEATASPEKNE